MLPLFLATSVASCKASPFLCVHVFTHKPNDLSHMSCTGERRFTWRDCSARKSAMQHVCRVVVSGAVHEWPRSYFDTKTWNKFSLRLWLFGDGKTWRTRTRDRSLYMTSQNLGHSIIHFSTLCFYADAGCKPQCTRGSPSACWSSCGACLLTDVVTQSVILPI